MGSYDDDDEEAIGWLLRSRRERGSSFLWLSHRVANSDPDFMNYLIEAAMSCICSLKALTVASYALVVLVHLIILWTHHVFMWSTRFNCTGNGCPDSTSAERIAECAFFYILISLLLTSYWRCILTSARSPNSALDAQSSASSSLHTAVDLQLSTANAVPVREHSHRRLGYQHFCSALTRY